MVNKYNSGLVDFLCADLQLKKQSLEIEIDKKERCLENKCQEKHQLNKLKRELEQKNDFIEIELDKFKKKTKLLKLQIYSHQNKFDQLVDELAKVNSTLEIFNERNIKINNVETSLDVTELKKSSLKEITNVVESPRNIAASYRNSGDLYLLYKKGVSKLYMNISPLLVNKNDANNHANNIFSLNTQTIIDRPTFICDTKIDLYGKAVFSTLQEEKLAYLTHKNGVLKLSIIINAETKKPSATCDEIFQEIKHGNKQVGSDTSLIDFHGYPFIANGKFILFENPKAQDGNDTGSRYCSTTGMLTGDKPNVDNYWWVYQWRSNAILEYFAKKFYLVGGNPYPQRHPVEVCAYAKEPTPGFRNYAALGPGSANPMYPFMEKEKQEQADCLLNVNCETHAHCRLGEKIFIFPRDLFHAESAQYYCYDVIKAEIKKYEVDSDFKKNVNAYSDFQVTPHVDNNIIYIILTKFTTIDFFTQIIVFNASVLDKAHFDIRGIEKNKEHFDISEIEKNEADSDASQIEENKADFDASEIEEKKADFDKSEIEKNKADSDASQIEENKADFDASEIEEKKADFDKREIEKNKADSDKSEIEKK